MREVLTSYYILSWWIYIQSQWISPKTNSLSKTVEDDRTQSLLFIVQLSASSIYLKWKKRVFFARANSKNDTKEKNRKPQRHSFFRYELYSICFCFDWFTRVFVRSKHYSSSSIHWWTAIGFSSCGIYLTVHESSDLMFALWQFAIFFLSGNVSETEVERNYFCTMSESWFYRFSVVMPFMVEMNKKTTLLPSNKMYIARHRQSHISQYFTTSATNKSFIHIIYLFLFSAKNVGRKWVLVFAGLLWFLLSTENVHSNESEITLQILVLCSFFASYLHCGDYVSPQWHNT